MPKRKAEKKKKSRRGSRGKILVGVLLVALFFGAYGIWQYFNQLPPAIGGETNTPPVIGSAANFILKDINGNQFILNQSSGKVIAIHFMAVGCSGQYNTINDNQLKQLKTVCMAHCGDHSISVVTVAVSTCSSNDLGLIRTKYGITWTFGNDYDDGKLEIVEAYKSYSILDGTILLIDKAFNVNTVYTEGITSTTLSAKINQLLGV
jgi:cytochrome oxidase Cu insertion factor (SCO1/SenC/PrrC family)